MCKEKSNICSCIFNIISSVLVAVAIAIVFYTGLVPAIAALLYITLILSILGLIGLVIACILCKKTICTCVKSTYFVTSAIGAIITSAFALAATGLASASIPVAILIGAVAFFLVSFLISAIKLLICLFCNTKSCCYDD